MARTFLFQWNIVACIIHNHSKRVIYIVEKMISVKCFCRIPKIHPLLLPKWTKNKKSSSFSSPFGWSQATPLNPRFIPIIIYYVLHRIIISLSWVRRRSIQFGSCRRRVRLCRCRSVSAAALLLTACCATIDFTASADQLLFIYISSYFDILWMKFIWQYVKIQYSIS